MFRLDEEALVKDMDTLSKVVVIVLLKMSVNGVEDWSFLIGDCCVISN